MNVTPVNRENISIVCDSDTEQVYWYLQPSGRPPAPTLRSFGGAAVELKFTTKVVQYVIAQYTVTRFFNTIRLNIIGMFFFFKKMAYLNIFSMNSMNE